MAEAVRVIPASWEVANGLLRRTPSLRALEVGGALVLNVEGRQVVLEPTESGEYYRASELYALSPRRPVYRFRPLPTGEVRVECREPEPRSTPPPPPPEREEAPKAAPPPRRKVVLEHRNGEWRIRETAAHPVPHLETTPTPSEAKSPTWNAARTSVPSPQRHPREALPLLLELLGHEEFAPEGVDPVLEHRGFRPEEVWRWLEAHGLVEKEAGFMRLKGRQRVGRG